MATAAQNFFGAPIYAVARRQVWISISEKFIQCCRHILFLNPQQVMSLGKALWHRGINAHVAAHSSCELLPSAALLKKWSPTAMAIVPLSKPSFDHGEASIMQASCKHHQRRPSDRTEQGSEASVGRNCASAALLGLKQYIGVAIACHSHIDPGPLQLQCRHPPIKISLGSRQRPCLDQRQRPDKQFCIDRPASLWLSNRKTEFEVIAIGPIV